MGGTLVLHHQGVQCWALPTLKGCGCDCGPAQVVLEQRGFPEAGSAWFKHDFYTLRSIAADGRTGCPEILWNWNSICSESGELEDMYLKLQEALYG